MKIVIDIDIKTFHDVKNKHITTSEINELMNAIDNGTILPEGPGRLIDANSIYQIVKPIEPSDAAWGMTAETAKQIIHDAFDRAPTIIKADK